MTVWLDFMGAEIRYVDTPTYGLTRIAEAGKGNKETLFLMHGIGGHIEAYSKNVVALAKDFHVIAFDFVGHGYSAKKMDIDYTPACYVEQLRELMDALGVTKANLEGESLGGLVAGMFAIKYPERMLRLILNTAGGIPIVSDKGRQDLANLAALSAKTVGQAPSFESVRSRMQWLIYEGNWDMLTDELINIRLKIYSQPEYQKSAPLVMARLNRVSKEGGAPDQMALEDIQAETLMFWTTHNPIHDVPAAESALPRLKHGQLYVMKKDAGHWPQYEGAEEHDRVVTHFLKTGAV